MKEKDEIITQVMAEGNSMTNIKSLCFSKNLWIIFLLLFIGFCKIDLWVGLGVLFSFDFDEYDYTGIMYLRTRNFSGSKKVNVESNKKQAGITKVDAGNSRPR